MRDDEENQGSDSSSRGFNFHLLKADNELFVAEDYVPAPIVQIKRYKKQKAEDWAILEDGQIVLKMKGTRFSKKEKEFLRTPEGLSFLIAAYKSGSKSVVKLKEQMKDLVTE